MRYHKTPYTGNTSSRRREGAANEGYSSTDDNKDALTPTTPDAVSCPTESLTQVNCVVSCRNNDESCRIVIRLLTLLVSRSVANICVTCTAAAAKGLLRESRTSSPTCYIPDHRNVIVIQSGEYTTFSLFAINAGQPKRHPINISPILSFAEGSKGCGRIQLGCFQVMECLDRNYHNHLPC